MDTVAELLEPGWLGRCLREPVAATSWRRIGTDRGFAGTVLRVELTAPDGAASSVVAKLGPDPALDAEIEFYRRFAGALDAPAPPCRYAGTGPHGEPLLLIEDVPATRQGDALAGAAVDDVAAVLTAMRRFWERQASSCGLTDLAPWGTPPHQRQQNFRRNWAAQRDALAAELPTDIVVLAEKLCDSLASVVADLRAAPAHPLHADLHLDNVLFTHEGPIVLDWGSLCLGAPSIDVFGFITGSLAPGDQEQYFADLVGALGLDADAVDQGRRRLLCALAGVVGWRNRAPTGIPREQELRTAAIADGRLVTALRLWDAGRLLG